MADVSRLCTICARAGSKGVPGKNWRPIAGKPLAAWTIDHARASGLFDAIALSSDSAELLDLAQRLNVDVIVDRPPALAVDTISKLPAIGQCVEAAEERLGLRFDQIVDLDVTSPLRRVEDIRGAVDLLESTGATNVLTAAPARRSPYFNMIEVDSGGVARLSKMIDRPITRRQDAPAVYDMNASIYVWRRDPYMARHAIWYDDTRLFVMPESRSVDIDTELDFMIVETLLQRRDDDAV